jgi:hypothetical protein
MVVDKDIRSRSQTMVFCNTVDSCRAVQHAMNEAQVCAPPSTSPTPHCTENGAAGSILLTGAPCWACAHAPHRLVGCESDA